MPEAPPSPRHRPRANARCAPTAPPRCVRHCGGPDRAWVGWSMLCGVKVSERGADRGGKGFRRILGDTDRPTISLGRAPSTYERTRDHGRNKLSSKRERQHGPCGREAHGPRYTTSSLHCVTRVSLSPVARAWGGGAHTCRCAGARDRTRVLAPKPPPPLRPSLPSLRASVARRARRARPSRAAAIYPTHIRFHPIPLPRRLPFLPRPITVPRACPRLPRQTDRQTDRHSSRP